MVRYGEAGPGPAGSAMTVEFQLEGQTFVALNGGPHFKFTEAISFVVNCQTQDEVDNYWQKLSAGGVEVECGSAEGQVRFVVADRSDGAGRVVERLQTRKKSSAS